MVDGLITHIKSNMTAGRHLEKNGYELRRRSSVDYEIWQADAKWYADEYTWIEIETGNRIPIWWPSVFQNRK